MDAVVLANYATEHAPYAVKVLDSGRHVCSEAPACRTLAEAVELVARRLYSIRLPSPNATAEKSLLEDRRDAHRQFHSAARLMPVHNVNRHLPIRFL